MSLTEGGACGTPCVATDIAGHRGAAIDGVTGLLVADTDRLDTTEGLGSAVADLLLDDERRRVMRHAAIEHSSGLSWSAVAARQLDVLCAAVASR